jgi:hypothetical protein
MRKLASHFQLSRTFPLSLLRRERYLTR